MIGVFSFIVMFALGSCGSSGDSRASYDWQKNYYYFSLNKGTCNPNFCKRETYDSNGNFIGYGLITAPKGKVIWVNPEVRNYIKETYNIIAERSTCLYFSNPHLKTCEAVENLTKKLRDYKYYSMADMWAYYLAYKRYVEVNNVLFLDVYEEKKFSCYKWLCNGKLNYYKIRSYECHKTGKKFIMLDYKCVYKYKGPVAPFLIKRYKEMRNIYSKSVNYGGVTYLGVMDLDSYSYFVMSVDIIQMPIKDISI
ncbi:MAG: hypothetical protein ABGW69_01245 [Nanoarchaeota archaeon]